MNWGFHIKRLREARNISQTDLAKRARLSRSHITNIERGVYKTFKTDTLKKLAFGLNMTVEELNREIFGTTTTRETPEQILERLRISISSTVPVYEDFPFHAGDSITPADYVAVVRDRAKGRNLEGYYVHGNCLEPDIQDNDIIIIDRDAQADIGNIVACLYQGELHLGKLKKIADAVYIENNNGRIKLEECPVVAKVIEVRRGLK